MTLTGLNRQRYAALMHDVDPRVSRFSPDYAAWCERADAWAEYNGLEA